MKRLFLFLTAIILLASVVSAQDTTLKLSGLKSKVTVRRDERSIPYIEANNEADLYFAQGYITAQDRLWQMDILRRTSRGELSEIFGKLAVEEDKRRRLYGFAKMSEQSATLLSAPARATLEAFASGVNAYIASCDEKTLPQEFRILKYQPRLWMPADSIVIGYLMAESLSSTWQADVMRGAFSDLGADKLQELFPEYSKIDTPVVGTDNVKARAAGKSVAQNTVKVSAEILAQASVSEELLTRSLERVGIHAEGLAASNNWVVSGKRTASGKPLLSNDPHLAPTVPGIWYLVHLTAPGMRVAGVSIPGVNGVIIGHNDRIAWGMTNLGPDVQDLYLEKFDPENPRRYQTPTGWKEAEVRREEIKVRKGALNPETESVNLDVTITRHGPIVLEKGAERYALKWTVFDPKLESITMFSKLNHARNWQDFSAALKTYAGATQNFVYADVAGHIGYYGAGYIPIRRSGDGSVPYDGTKDDGEWTGMIPFEKLPYVFDPPSGIIVTANARIVGKDYPYHLTHGWSAPYRQKRINDLLAAKNKITADDFRAVQGDVYAIGGTTFAREVVKAFGQSASDEKLKDTLKMFAAWDGKLTPDSKAALLIYELRDVFFNKLLVNQIGAEKAKQYRWTNRHSIIDRIVTEWPQAWLPKDFASWQAYLQSCNDDARAILTKKYGADESKWTWGQAIQVKFAHPLASAPMIGAPFKIAAFPQFGNGYTGGTGPTVNVGPTVSMRMIADPANWDNTQHGIPLGQSGDPKNPHYQDQLDDWRNVTPRVFPFSKEAVSKAAKTTVMLEPK